MRHLEDLEGPCYNYSDPTALHNFGSEPLGSPTAQLDAGGGLEPVFHRLYRIKEALVASLCDKLMVP